MEGRSGVDYRMHNSRCRWKWAVWGVVNGYGGAAGALQAVRWSGWMQKHDGELELSSCPLWEEVLVEVERHRWR